MHKTGDLTRKLDTERGEAGNGNFLSAGYISSLIFFQMPRWNVGRKCVLSCPIDIQYLSSEIFKCWNPENNALVYSLFSRILKSWVPVFKVLFFLFDFSLSLL